MIGREECVIPMYSGITAFEPYVMHFHFAFWNKLGAMFDGALPLIQLECQNRALLPFTTATIVNALNNAMST